MFTGPSEHAWKILWTCLEINTLQPLYIKNACMHVYLQHVLVGNVPLLSFVITGEKLVTWFELQATDAYKIASYLPLAYMHQ